MPQLKIPRAETKTWCSTKTQHSTKINKYIFLKKIRWEFPGGPVVGTWCFSLLRAQGSVPSWGIKIPQVTGIAWSPQNSKRWGNKSWLSKCFQCKITKVWWGNKEGDRCGFCDAVRCCTITVLISHASKVMFKIFQRSCMDRELPDVQAGFQRGRGTREQIANTYWIEKHLLLLYWLC